MYLRPSPDLRILKLEALISDLNLQFLHGWSDRSPSPHVAPSLPDLGSVKLEALIVDLDLEVLHGWSC